MCTNCHGAVVKILALYIEGPRFKSSKVFDQIFTCSLLISDISVQKAQENKICMNHSGTLDNVKAF